jgi:hypothetical protein
MRTDGMSLRQAARASAIAPTMVIRLAKSALRKNASGRYAATKRDRLLRVLNVPSARGLHEIVTRDSRTASQLGAFNAAVQKYITTGDAHALKPFRKLRLFDARGRRIPLPTNLNKLNELGHAGQLSFESMYARTSR